MPKLAIFGGTFNPVHWGHLLLAETALNQCTLDRVIWIPTYHPPHKSPVILGFEHRLAMVRLAIADHPNFSVSDIESAQPGISYAIDTFTALQAYFPGAEWHWILGWDAFQKIHQWRGIGELATQCRWLVAPRPGAEMPDAPVPSQVLLSLTWQTLTMPSVGISSSLVRQFCHDRHSIRYLVPESVRQYILSRSFYTPEA